MTAAIFGLVGVVIGGLITGGIDYFLERRRESREVRRARRLVALELDTLAVNLSILIEIKVLPREDALSTEGPAPFLSSQEWEQHKALLAAELSDSEWDSVAAAYDVLVPVRATLLSAEPESAVDPSWNLPHLLHYVSTALEALGGKTAVSDLPPEALSAMAAMASQAFRQDHPPSQ